MMRVLLATEGSSDQVIGTGLVRRYCADAQVDPKAYPAPGFVVIKRSAPTLARAGHFGHYDILIVHFDIDDTLKSLGVTDVAASERWQAIDKTIRDKLSQQGTCGRAEPLRIVLMAPRESSDAWLHWALNGGDGVAHEEKDRHTLKHRLYGNPPLGMSAKAKALLEPLFMRMDATKEDNWPPSLRFFTWQLKTALTRPSP